MADELILPGSGAGTAPPLDVFISYAREDRAAAQVLAAALVDSGISVWWDRQIAGGQDFTDVIAERLAAARVVLVLWSQASVASNFVRDEATRARDVGKLLPVRIQDVRPPLGFGTIHTLDLLDWDGERADPAWAELLANVKRGPAGLPQNLGAPGRQPWQRWRRPLALAALLAALVGAGVFGWNAWREQQALAQFQSGLNAHFAQDRNLQAARNAYLSALRDDPELGRAHYYLAHVYALLILPRDARTQFGLALRFANDLDEGQRDDARVQLAALDLDQEAAPVTRAALPTTSAQPAPSPPPVQPAPAPDKLTLGKGAGTATAPEARVSKDTGTQDASKRMAELSRNVEDLKHLPAATVSPKPAPASAASVAPAHLPRVAPSPEQQRVIEMQVNALFAPLAQTRLSAATALALDPGLMSDTVAAAIERSLTGLREAPPSEAAIAGATNTLQLLLSASPATLKANDDAALRLLDMAQSLGENQRATALQLRTLIGKAQSARAPVVYIQIANDAQDPLAQALAERIRASGYAVPTVEHVGARAPSRSEVRVQGGSVQGWARWLSKIVGDYSGEPAGISTLRGARPANDTFEIWLDKDLCVTAQRQVPRCSP